MTVLRLTGRVAGVSSLTAADLATLRDAGQAADAASGGGDDAVPASAVIDAAAPTAEASYCSVVSADGSYSASIPLDELAAGGWLAFRRGDGPLPREAGGPIRLVVTESATLCWNVKDVGELRFTASKHPDSVPARPTH